MKRERRFPLMRDKDGVNANENMVSEGEKAGSGERGGFHLQAGVWLCRPRVMVLHGWRESLFTLVNQEYEICR